MGVQKSRHNVRQPKVNFEQAVFNPYLPQALTFPCSPKICALDGKVGPLS